MFPLGVRAARAARPGPGACAPCRLGSAARLRGARVQGLGKDGKGTVCAFLAWTLTGARGVVSGGIGLCHRVYDECRLGPSSVNRCRTDDQQGTRMPWKEGGECMQRFQEPDHKFGKL